jgi:hypothetical protein
VLELPENEYNYTNLELQKAFVGPYQLPEKYKENFDVSSEGPSSELTSH